jgi:hypothetical protein
MSNTNITVIDSVMGSGKSAWAISMINDNPDENYIIVVPTLEECTRYKDSIDRVAFEPRSTEATDSAKTLQDRFKLLAEDNRTIITTHRMLECLDSESLDMLRNRNYTLILDEVTDLVSPYSGIHRKDYELLLTANVVAEEIQADGITKIIIGSKAYSDIVSKDLKHSAFTEAVKSGNMFRVRGSFFILVGSTERFRVFNNVYIMTYLFKGGIMDAWLTYHNDTYKIKSINEGELVAYSDRGGSEFDHLVKLVDDRKLNKIGRKRNLSSSWYKTAKPESMTEMKSNLKLFFRRNNVDAKDCMWSTFKDKSAAIAPEGYITTQNGLTFKLALAIKDPIEKAQKLCFIPINARATNNYKHKSAVAVCVNYYPYPSIVSFFQDVGVTFDQDRFALSEMIQLVWRSRIREGKEIALYLPSERMRGLLTNWLNVAPF